jgi:hypothetical protein
MEIQSTHFVSQSASQSAATPFSRRLAPHLPFSVLDANSDRQTLKGSALRVAGLLFEKRYASELVFEPTVRVRRLEQKYFEATNLEKRITEQRQILGLLETGLDDSIPSLGGYALIKKTGSMDSALLQELLARPPGESPSDLQALYERYIAGAASKRNISTCRGALHFHSPSQWFEYTHYSLGHDAPGKVTALLMVETADAFERCGFAQKLLGAMLKYARSSGSDFAFGFARVPGLRKKFPNAEDAHAHLQEYISEKRAADGLHPDHYIRFHQRAGGQLMCGIPFVAEDHESHHCGALVVYDLRNR